MKTTKREQLYQVWAEETATGRLIPVPAFPRMGKEAVDMFAETIRSLIACGKLKTYANPQVVPHISVEM